MATPSEGPSALEPEPGGEALVVMAELEEISEQIASVALKKDLFYLWALLGVSPLTLPVFFGVSRFGFAALLTVSVLVSVFSFREGSRRGTRLRELEELAAERRSELEGYLGVEQDSSRIEAHRLGRSGQQE